MGTIIKHTYNVWQHILEADNDFLMYKALETNIHLDREGFTTYYSRFKGLLEVLGEKNKVYPLHNKIQAKKEAISLSKKYNPLYESEFVIILDNINENSKSKGKYAMYMYCKVKHFYHVSQKNICIRICIRIQFKIIYADRSQALDVVKI